MGWIRSESVRTVSSRIFSSTLDNLAHIATKFSPLEESAASSLALAMMAGSIPFMAAQLWAGMKVSDQIKCLGKTGPLQGTIALITAARRKAINVSIVPNKYELVSNL